MQHFDNYLSLATNPVLAIAKGLDNDVKTIEGILLLGYGLVLLAPLLAPIASPETLLPAMALVFFGSVCGSRLHFYKLRSRLLASNNQLQDHHQHYLKPLLSTLNNLPQQTLTEGFDPLKNRLRTFNSFVGALCINPFWMPIFYLLSMQIAEEKQLQQLKQNLQLLKQKTQYWANQ